MPRLRALCVLFTLHLTIMACGGDDGGTVLDPGPDPGGDDGPGASPLNFDCSGVDAAAYITVRQRNTPDVIQVLDSSNRVACNISTDFLGKIAFTPDGDAAFISSALSTVAKVQVVDVESHSLTRVIDVAGAFGRSEPTDTGPALFIVDAAVSPRGELAFFAGLNRQGLFAVETATDSIFQLLDDVGISEFTGSADANQIWFVGAVGPNQILGRIDLDTGEFQSFNPNGFGISGLAVSPDGAFLYTASINDSFVRVVDTSTLEILNGIDLPAPGRGVEVGPSGTRVFVVSPPADELYVIDVGAGSVESAVPLGGDVQLEFFGNELSVSPDGSTVLVQLEASVAVVDVSSAEVIRIIDAGDPELADVDREVQDVRFRPR